MGSKSEHAKHDMKKFAFFRFSLPLQLFIFLLCVLPLLWSLIAFDLHRSYARILNEGRTSAVNLAHAFAEEVKSSVNSIDYTLIDLREAWQSSTLDSFAEKVRRRQAYLESNVAFQVAIIDAKGMLAFSSVDPQAKPMSLSDREHFLVHRQRTVDELFISKPVLGRVSRRWSIQFTRPLQNAAGQFDGVIVISVSPDYFSRFYQTIDLGPDSIITLLRASGEILARSPNPELGIGKAISDRPFMNAGSTATNGVYQKPSYSDGIERLSAWRKLPKGNLVVVVGHSLDSLFAPYRQQRRTYYSVGASFSILLTLAGYFLLTVRRQRANAAAVLTESETRWKFALEGAGDGVWDWEVPEKKMQFSARWKQILGFAADELDNDFDEWRKRIHPDDMPRVMNDWQAHLNSETSTYVNEHRLLCKDGTWKWGLARGIVVIRAVDQSALRVVGTLTDITERKHNEEALRQSLAQTAAEQQRMKIILENSYDAFIAVDSDGMVTDWTTQAERTFGWSAAEAIGRDLSELIIPQEQRQAHNAGFRCFATTGNATIINNVVEVDALHRSGRRIPVELAVAGFQHGNKYAVNAFIRDISERKKAEMLEAQRKAQLEETREILHHSQKLEAVGKLTGGVAHDFNNVLQVIRGNLELMQIQLGEHGPIEKRLQSAINATERGSKLSSQLLAFARRQPLQPKVINLSRIVKNIDDMLRRTLEESIEIETIVSGGLWNTLVDPNQLENVILNLTINARDAMKGSGKLTIELGNAMLDDEYVLSEPSLQAGQYIVLSVSDTGSGMPANVMAQAFEPFFTTKPEGQGTGLGLSMAYGFVKQSGGHIRLYSEIGHGTTVRIYLPRSFDTETASILDDSTEPAMGGEETILMVEDDAEVRATVSAMLTDLGYNVLIANDGESGLNVIKSGVPIDLLFTDVVMPGPLRSVDMVKQAKLMHPDLAVLFTSGYTQNAIMNGGRLDPGVHLLSKPYRREQLARKIRYVLSAS